MITLFLQSVAHLGIVFMSQNRTEAFLDWQWEGAETEFCKIKHKFKKKIGECRLVVASKCGKEKPHMHCIYIYIYIYNSL